MGKEEQVEEREVLESIFPDEITSTLPILVQTANLQKHHISRFVTTSGRNVKEIIACSLPLQYKLRRSPLSFPKSLLPKSELGSGAFAFTP